MIAEPRTHQFKATGTLWKITIWDDMTLYRFAELCKKIETYCEEFESLYSRFRPTSLVTQLGSQLGVVEVPPEFTDMLQWYFLVYMPTRRKVNPAIGVALTDAGYDAQLSFQEKDVRRPVPDLFAAVRIIDKTHIELLQPVMFDFGALGKGYLVDKCAAILAAEGVRRSLVDGGGDLFYTQDDGTPITVGLEHPWEEGMLVGVATLHRGSICGSAINRRRWASHHHYIDPHTHQSPQDIVAVWVAAGSAVAADALASCLFFVNPEAVAVAPFEYCIINKEMRLKHSPNFTAEFYTA